LAKHDIGDKYKCGECGKEFVTTYKLMEHIAEHANKKEYKCSGGLGSNLKRLIFEDLYI
jgi:hypothetical protein